MIGIYETIDQCRYEVFITKHGKPAKDTLMAKCIHSTVPGSVNEAFALIDGQLINNIRLNTWKKIED